MSGTEFGLDYRIAVDDAHILIGGEISFDWKRSSQEIDISTKDDGIYGSTSYGQQKISFSVSGNLKLPDAGFAALFAASKERPPHIAWQVVKGAIVKYEGIVAIGNFSSTAGKDGPVTYAFDATNVGTPTVDDLGATA
jgi:predicted secreted protein